jgi:hypothetical protein
MKLTDAHTNLHLTLTVLQFSYSLHSVSVSYLCHILWYEHQSLRLQSLWAAQAQQTKHQLQMAPNHTTHSTWKVEWHRWTHRSSSLLERVTCGATSSVFWRYCSWNGSMIVLAANRWQSKALAAGSVHHTDGINHCLTTCPTHQTRSNHIPELRHRIQPHGLATYLTCSRLPAP